MHRLALHFLGPPYIELGTDKVGLKRVDVRLAKANALLTYLSVTRQGHSRETLATLLWPESDAGHARTSLRSILSRLNNTLGYGWLTTTRKRVALNDEADIWLDVAHFEDRILACSTHGHAETETCPQCISSLKEAVKLYRGDFLSGFSLADSLLFDEWQLSQSERLRAMQADALARLSDCLSSSEHNQIDIAIQYAQRRVALDPYDEYAHQQLIQLYLTADQRAEALRQYQTCVDILERELAIPPSTKTTSLYRQIQEIRPHLTPPSAIHLPQPRSDFKLPHYPNLEAPFFGREAEHQAVDFLLRSTDTCRLVTLVGPGGIGKTRLALEIARALRTAFTNGVVVVNLESVDEVEFIMPTIADALDLETDRDITARVLSTLASRHCLLLLDNFEHLMAGVELVSDIMQSAPRVKLLVTSQEPLHLQGEWLVRVAGLHYPDIQATDNVTDYSAIQLFLSTAQRAKPDFTPAVDDWPWIAEICRLVDGMPLGIELAARWVRLLTCREIALKIEDNLAFLATTLRDVPERHRSLYAVFKHAWTLLSSEERQVFEDMTVFVGGFDEKAAQHVAGASLPVLLSLVERGLLRRHSSGRYDRHPLLWYYAAEKLASNPVRHTDIQMRHCSYYTDFLETQLLRIRQAAGKNRPNEIEAEILNIRTALNWAVTQRQECDVAQKLERLYYDYERQAWLRPEV